MSTVPIRWRPLGGRDLVAGEVLFAKAVASWQEAWFCEPALKVEAAALLEPLESFAAKEQESAWTCGPDVWLFAEPRQLTRMANRALDLPTRFAPVLESRPALLANVETRLVDELLDALRRALLPALKGTDGMHACKTPMSPHLPYGGAHFRLVTPKGDTVLALVCGAQTLWSCLPLNQRQPTTSPAHLPSNRTSAVEDTRVSLRAMLGQCELTVAQLATLAVGDVIRLDRAITETVALELARSVGAPRTVVATATPGQRAGKLSIQLTSITGPDTL
ncbi:FliM/FliN family flagellar motor switch protein [Paraburkholderia metrosideri]|uniref:Flagellar motor switch protein FliN-like C-terminal domain-containing protein n=1 Tax=Paraburkholderia metrosideri TaxID=580937 RepID=A0ABM8NYB5_9BURK|nr:FliM/FliN family flagellar motor C-terminal domain-containing protein [Paraburkholderia metrosideri]CAD6549116.1 hypothetical protein LMG28140_04710 [Paraburkholderia metrosideri]